MLQPHGNPNCDELDEEQFRNDPTGFRNYVPGRQFVRSHIARLVYAATGTLPTFRGDGLATVQFDETVWRHDLNRDPVVREELTYRRDEGIPIRFTSSVDGKESTRLEVLHLEFTGEGP